MSTVKIAHLSDPHFGTLNEGIEEELTKSLKRLQPDLILMSGDITQRARRYQFKAAKNFATKFRPIPVFAVPGNHDIPLFNLFGRLFFPYHGFHKYFQPAREADLRLGDVRVVALNSTSRWRHVQGKLNLTRIRSALLDNWHDTKVRIAVVHHPLACKKNSDEKNLLRGCEEAISLFDEAKIDLVLSGHVHDPFVTLARDRYPGCKRAMILSVAGTCLSWRTRPGAPNSFNFIEIETSESPRIRISRMDLNENKTFAPLADETREFELT